MILKKLDYGALIVFSVLLGLAPFYPEPHLVQKFKMLFSGAPFKPLDYFDIILHSAPILILIAKYVYEKIIEPLKFRS